MAGRDGDFHEMPADLAAVQADDALLDLIGRAGCTADDAHDELTRVLAGWRQEMDAEPFGEFVDTDTAVAAIRAGRHSVRRRNPVFGSIAGAAAVLVIAFSGVGLAAKSAQPGDHLWGVTQVLYGDYAHSVETAAQVRTELNEAKSALKQGDPERARASLQRVQKQLPAIGDTEGRTDLTARSRELEQQVVQSAGPPMESPPMPGPSMTPNPLTGSRATDWSKERAVPAKTPPTPMQGTTSDDTMGDGTTIDGTTSDGASRPGRPPIPRPNAGPDSRPGTDRHPAPGPSSSSLPYPGPSSNPGLHPHPGAGVGSGQQGPYGWPRTHGLAGQPGSAAPPELPGQRRPVVPPDAPPRSAGH